MGAIPPSASSNGCASGRASASATPACAKADSRRERAATSSCLAAASPSVSSGGVAAGAPAPPMATLGASSASSITSPPKLVPFEPASGFDGAATGFAA